MLIGTMSWLHAALPTPLVDLSFSEATGETTSNTGSLGGIATFVAPDGFPAFATNIPEGAYAPDANLASLDMGAIAAGQGGRAVDLFTDQDSQGTLGFLEEMTICGWLNPQDLNEGFGGNRIAFALVSPNGAGFDLVSLANGALRIGINQWPDGGGGGGPSSSVGKLVADAETGSSNWVFFAVTYKPFEEAGQLRYYFGKPDRLATLDTVHNYLGGLPNGGIIESTGPLSLGNFGTVVGARNETGPGGPSRVFRGLMDELKVYDRALSLVEVQQAQLNGAVPAVPLTITRQPSSQVGFVGQSLTFEVEIAGSAPFTFQWQTNGVDIVGATDASFTWTNVTLADNGLSVQVRLGNPVTAALLSDVATLTVLPEDGHKISVSFPPSGETAANFGNLLGSGIYASRDGYPLPSTSVPTGPYAPPDNVASVDFGVISDGQGGRAIDFSNDFGNTMGPMQAFTACGWLNAADLRVGFGGNRILFALAAPNGPGFDLVQLGDGSLQLGVNQWPDGSPARSSAGLITEDPELGSANWVFFAVAYDGTQPAANVNFYFGTADQPAQLDRSADYDRGPILQSGALTVGNFGVVAGARNELGPTGGSRCFRGLIDEINVYNKLITLEEIQQIQVTPARTSTTRPVLQVQRGLNNLVELSWKSTDSFQLQSRTSVETGDWVDVGTTPTVQDDRSTVALVAGTETQFFRLRNK
jgi:hypothetical protein